MRTILLAKALETGHKRFIPKRSIILQQGEVPASGFMVLKGCFKAYRLDKDGCEQVVGFRTQNDIFPEIWLMKKTEVTLYYYEAIEDAEVVTLSRDVLWDVMSKDIAVCSALLRYFVNNHTGFLLQATALGRSRAADKLLFLFLYLMFRHSRQTKSGAYVITLPLTHALIGSVLGITRETTTMELRKLAEKGVISYKGRTFKIHKAAFLQLLREENIDEEFSLYQEM